MMKLLLTLLMFRSKSLNLFHRLKNCLFDFVFLCIVFFKKNQKIITDIDLAVNDIK